MTNNNKISQGEQSKFNTSLDILQHLNHMLFAIDMECMSTTKQAHYNRWRLLQRLDMSLLPYMNKEERWQIAHVRVFDIPNITGDEWVRSGVERVARQKLDEYEAMLRLIMSRAGFHIRENERMDGWDL